MTGTLLLLRANLRRDRWLMLWWSVAAALLYYSQAVSVDGLYETQAEFDKAAASMEGNAAFIAMAGPARALNTTGGQVTWQATAFGAIVAGLMTMLIIGRHTRAEEETGRDELVRATAIDRAAPMTAALGTALVANLLLGGLVALSLWTYPLAGRRLAGARGSASRCAGCSSGAVTLLAAQVTSTVRATYGLTGAAIGAAYALRAVGDVGDGTLSLALADRLVPGDARLLRPAVVAGPAARRRRGVVVVRAAYAVFDRRDIGSGVLAGAARPGAGRSRRGSLALAWRLQRGQVLGWSAGLLFVGLAYGSIGDSVRRPGRRLGGHARGVRAGRRPRGRLLRHVRADAGRHRGRLRGVVGAAATW